MFRTASIAFLFASACVHEPSKPQPLQGSLSTAEAVGPAADVGVVGNPVGPVVVSHGAPLGGTLGDGDVLFGSLASWDGRGLEDAAMCTSEGCVKANGAFAAVELAEGEVSVWVTAKDSVVRHLQIVKGGSAHITVPTLDEADTIASGFGVERKPGLGTLIQYVDSTSGVKPALSVQADGPYFLDGRGAPMPAADTVTQGYYVYFNVPPGLHRVDLPSCDEGELFWGTPSDESIDVEMFADGWLGLAPVDCIH